MGLTTFDSLAAPVVASWAASAQEARHWCSRDHVSAAVVADWSATPDVVAYTFVEHDQVVGYGELWIDADEEEVELARLIVAPARRGQGLGRRLAAALTAQALTHYPAVFMRVYPDNEPALRCYAAAGFTPVPQDQADEWNQAQPAPYVWLRYAT